MLYSQNNEEEIIIDYFKGKVGKFLDIGAYSPFNLSNTRRLVELGWAGIYVEPSPICFQRFVETYSKDSNITLYNYALGIENGKAIFYESGGDAVSTLDLGHKEKWEKGSNVKYHPITVDVVKIEEFFEQSMGNIDFLSLDTEALNIEIFDRIPDFFWDNLSLLCIEHDNKIEHICQRLPSFRQLLYNPENLILGR